MAKQGGRGGINQHGDPKGNHPERLNSLAKVFSRGAYTAIAQASDNGYLCIAHPENVGFHARALNQKQVDILSGNLNLVVQEPENETHKLNLFIEMVRAKNPSIVGSEDRSVLGLMDAKLDDVKAAHRMQKITQEERQTWDKILNPRNLSRRNFGKLEAHELKILKTFILENFDQILTAKDIDNIRSLGEIGRINVVPIIPEYNNVHAEARAVHYAQEVTGEKEFNIGLANDTGLTVGCCAGCTMEFTILEEDLGITVNRTADFSDNKPRGKYRPSPLIDERYYRKFANIHRLDGRGQGGARGFGDPRFQENADLGGFEDLSLRDLHSSRGAGGNYSRSGVPSRSAWGNTPPKNAAGAPRKDGAWSDSDDEILLRANAPSVEATLQEGKEAEQPPHGMPPEPTPMSQSGAAAAVRQAQNIIIHSQQGTSTGRGGEGDDRGDLERGGGEDGRRNPERGGGRYDVRDPERAGGGYGGRGAWGGGEDGRRNPERGGGRYDVRDPERAGGGYGGRGAWGGGEDGRRNPERGGGRYDVRDPERAGGGYGGRGAWGGGEDGRRNPERGGGRYDVRDPERAGGGYGGRGAWGGGEDGRRNAGVSGSRGGGKGNDGKGGGRDGKGNNRRGGGKGGRDGR